MLNIFLLALTGLLILAPIFGLSGAVYGAMIGGLCGTVFSLNGKLRIQQRRIDALEHAVEIKALTPTPPAAQRTVSVPADSEVEQIEEDSEVRSAKRIPLAERLGELRDTFELAPNPTTTRSSVQTSTTPKTSRTGPSDSTDTLQPLSPWAQRVDSSSSQDREHYQSTGWINSLLEKTNLVTRIGIVILFFGVSFLLRYVASSASISPSTKIMAVVLGAFFLFEFGRRLRESRPTYSVLLQGASVGIWYIATYISMKVFGLVTPGLGFFLLVLLSITSAAIAVKHDAKSLAIFGIMGGFLAPVLASSGDGSHVILFSYYAVLNAGILLIVSFKPWRVLSLMGFVFTFLIAVMWGVTAYQPEYFTSTEPFLILFMLFYVAVVMIFALRKDWEYEGFVDGAILYGTPAIGFGLQGALVENFEYGMAWSALGFGIFYLALAASYWKALSERAVLLRDSLLAIGLVFVSLSIPYAFDHDVSALLWALEGAGGLWLAVRQQRTWGCCLALLAQLGAGLFWLADNPLPGGMLFFNATYLNAVIIAAVGVYAAWLLRNHPKKFWPGMFTLPALVWGLVWWFVAGIWQLHSHVGYSQFPGAFLLFVSASFLGIFALKIRYKWSALVPVLMAFMPVCVVTAIFSGHYVSHPMAGLGFLAWPVTIVTLYWIHNRGDLFGTKDFSREELWHAISLLLAVGILTWEVLWRVRQFSELVSWSMIGCGVISLAAAWIALKFQFWRHELSPLYRETIPGCLFVSLLLNFLVSCFVAPDVYPVPYAPLLSPIDLWQLAVLGSAFLWWRLEPERMLLLVPQKTGFKIIAGLLFIYINTLLLRTLHLLGDIPWDAGHLFGSDLVQTCFAILWAVMGVGLLIYANTNDHRGIWKLGMTLIGIVVVKLLLVDLGNSDTMERIVSFMVVGMLLLGVGYWVPIPEKEEAVNLQ